MFYKFNVTSGRTDTVKKKPKFVTTLPEKKEEKIEKVEKKPRSKKVVEEVVEENN